MCAARLEEVGGNSPLSFLAFPAATQFLPLRHQPVGEPERELVRRPLLSRGRRGEKGLTCEVRRMRLPPPRIVRG